MGLDLKDGDFEPGRWGLVLFRQMLFVQHWIVAALTFAVAVAVAKTVYDHNSQLRSCRSQ